MNKNSPILFRASFLIFISAIILFNINIDIVNAVQIKGTTGDIAVTLTTVSVTMDGEVDPSINKMNIILDVYDETSKKVVAGPTTVLGKLGETRTTGSVDISKLDGSRNYLLRGKEASTTSTGDKFEVPFNTLKKPTSATNTPAGDAEKKKCDIDKAGFSPYGNTNDGFFKESNKPTISIVMQTINCAGQELKLTVKELDRCVGSFIPGQNCNDKLTSSDLDNKIIKIPSTGNLTLKYAAGEENCESLGIVPDGYDCLYYFELAKPDGSKWSSMGKAGGAISYECDGVCDTDWEFKNQEEDVREVGAIDPRIATNEYTLLAPIGEIKSIGEGRTLGDYINLIVTIFLGICGALAVIMIIIYGLQWMGTDSVFGKTEAKQNIGGALMGLVLALGSWMLLNTINPDLLGGDLSIGQANIEVELDAMTSNDELPPEGIAVARCPEGITQVATAGGIFPVCRAISEDLKKLINSAWSQGLKITGYGFRSKKRQEELRAKYCKGTANVYNEKAKCNPETAIPGTSMHESGRAFDFQCEGLKISTKDNKCYLWLKSNSNKLLKNLPSEPWHWSTSGH